jgi:hypothetical protein
MPEQMQQQPTGDEEDGRAREEVGAVDRATN